MASWLHRENASPLPSVTGSDSVHAVMHLEVKFRIDISLCYMAFIYRNISKEYKTPFFQIRSFLQ